MKTFALSCLVAIGTLVVMWFTSLSFFASGGGIIAITIMAWIAGSVFAFEHRPRHLWLHVALLAIVVTGVINVYFMALPRLFAPPPGAIRGGSNMPMPMPPQSMPPIPQEK